MFLSSSVCGFPRSHAPGEHLAPRSPTMIVLARRHELPPPPPREVPAVYSANIGPSSAALIFSADLTPYHRA